MANAHADPGPKPELAWLPIDKMSVDAKYQRDTGSRRSQNLIARIAADFRWSRFGIVLTVKHRDGWFVIDGQHRVEACRLRGDIDRVPAVVLPHATVAAAAADFVAINRDRVAVTALHIHHAQLAAGDPVAKTIARVCAAAGVGICRYPVPSDKMVPGQTLAVASIGRIIRLRGEDGAIAVLKRVMATSGRAPGGCNAQAMRSVSDEMGIRNTRGGGDLSAPRNLGAVKTRLCLRCQQPFASSGPGNRICPRHSGVGE